jgi:putative PIN family toxin of toxin-antitoxin system
LRITLDTNVLVSAFISKLGHPADILELVIVLDEIELVLSEEILQEFQEVLSRGEVKTRLAYSEPEVAEFVEAIRGVAEIVAIESDLKVVKEDPEDDVVVNTAYDGKADYIVSGDKHLLRLRRIKRVRVVSPTSFLKLVAKEFGDLMLSDRGIE